jgi:ABC-type dipeptide/oligopeptide/nickel transport system permease component
VTTFRSWAPYLARRLLASVVVLVGVASITFFVTHTLGSPVSLLVGEHATPEIKREMTHRLGLDKPLSVQYGQYLTHAARGDFGYSTHTYNAVRTDVAERLPATIELVMAALVLTIMIGIPVGIAAGSRAGRLFDRLSGVASEVGASVPAFWIGLLLIFLFFYKWNLVPTPLGRLDETVQAPESRTGFLVVDSILAGNTEALRSALAHLVLPAFTLALVALPSVIQITRNTMAHVLQSDYIRTARCFGIPSVMLYPRYAFKNVVGPILAVLAMTLGFLIGNSVLVEVVFAWPGIGQYAVESMNSLDYAPVVAIVLITATFYIVAYLIADIIHAAIDPRVRLR